MVKTINLVKKRLRSSIFQYEPLCNLSLSPISDSLLFSRKIKRETFFFYPTAVLK